MQRAVALLALICVRQLTGTEEVLTLDHAISLALQANRLILSSGLEVKKFDEQLAATRTRRLPVINWYALGSQRLTDVNFHFDQGVFGIFPGIGPIPGKNTTIRTPLKPAALLLGRIDQPLSQQYGIGLGLHQQALGRDSAREQERAQRQSVVNSVKRAYYEILQTQSALESVEKSIELYKELDRLTEQYVDQQVALKSDSLEVKMRLAQAEYNVLALRNPLATQKEHLNSLLGRDIQVEFRVAPAEEARWTDTDLAAARRLALEQRPEIRQARLKVEQAEYDRRSKKAEYIPNLSLSFNYISPVNFGSLIPSNIAMAGLLLDWEPFDWGRKKHELAQKTYLVQQAQLRLRETQDQIAIEVNSKYRKLQETRQLLVIAHLGQETAREKLRVVKNRFSQQASLLKDVLQVQTSLADADNQYQQALLNFWSAKADYEQALGEDQ
ncbi:MAG TPA: TolC family protein [Acidobacteriota bacterium]|nr:TolC family protein [Acidobacteriota bacterium]